MVVPALHHHRPQSRARSTLESNNNNSNSNSTVIQTNNATNTIKIIGQDQQ